MKFVKMHGLGNDFVFIENKDGRDKNFSELARCMCKRHTGIGADGLIIIAGSDAADVRMRIINADGSEAEMCGNGIRCVSRYLYDNKLTVKKEFQMETGAGILVPKIMEEGGKVTGVRVDMGEPRLAAADIPFAPAPGEAADALWHEIGLDGASARFSCVNMGNPHAVLVVDDVHYAPVAEWGARLERHPQFPERVNVGFMQVLDAHHIRLRVFERGTGETQACGTGACAAAVAGMRAGLLARQGAVCVSLPGGDLQIEWAADNHVLMSGSAATVFEGTVTY